MSERHDEQGAIPVVEERARVDKEEVTTQTVRLRTMVHEDEHVIATPLRHKRVEVCRVAVDRTVDQAVPDRQEGDTLIISVCQETAKITKQFQVVEEIRIRTWFEDVDHREVVRLRRTEVAVDTDDHQS